MGAAFGLGFVIGPVLGGFLGEYGSRVPFFATAGLIFFNLLVGLIFLPESHTPNNRRPFEIRRANPFSAMKQMSQFKIAFGIIGVLFLYNMGHHALPAVWTFWGIEKFDWTPREIGYSLGFIGILMVFSQGYLIRIVIPALGMRWAGLVGLSFTITAFLGYALSQTPTMAYMFMIAGALGGLAGPAMSGIASSQVGPAQQGELQGAIGSVGSLTNIISPLMMTIVFGIYAAPDAPFYFPGAPFILAAILTMMSLSLFFWITIGFAQKATEDPS